LKLSEVPTHKFDDISNQILPFIKAENHSNERGRRADLMNSRYAKRGGVKLSKQESLQEIELVLL
jgi:hypothetical protein